MKIAVLTLGCRTNQAESSRIEQHLQASGHETVDSAKDAEICIINTCSVTAKADYQSRQLISRAVRAGAEVIVTGCYAELNRSLLIEKNRNIKIVENSNKHNIISLIPNNSSSIVSHSVKSSRHRPVIKVQDGCNNQCSYCIIPKARGRSVSIDPDNVLNEIVFYQSCGFEEIVLSGIHLGIYGKDLSPEINLANLLQLILSKTSVKRIRLSSLEINELSDELLEILSEPRICRHLHLPLQSGDDEILGRMNRSYSVAEYINTIDRVHDKFSNFSIGTDLIAGFPGESELNFTNTLKNVDLLNLSYLHVFPYSARSETAAASMPNQVNEKEKKKRVQTLREIGQNKKLSFFKKNLGLEHEIICETQSGDVIIGTTSNFIRVHVLHDASLKPGRLVRIRLTDMKDERAIGFPIRSIEPLDK